MVCCLWKGNYERKQCFFSQYKKSIDYIPTFQLSTIAFGRVRLFRKKIPKMHLINIRELKSYQRENKESKRRGSNESKFIQKIWNTFMKKKKDLDSRILCNVKLSKKIPSVLLYFSSLECNS